jgi:hypothetical protein
MEKGFFDEYNESTSLFEFKFECLNFVISFVNYVSLESYYTILGQSRVAIFSKCLRMFKGSDGEEDRASDFHFNVPGFKSRFGHKNFSLIFTSFLQSLAPSGHLVKALLIIINIALFSFRPESVCDCSNECDFRLKVVCC